VREMAARHPNFVKIWVDDNLGKVPKMKPEVYRAAIDEAHKHHLKVAAHVYYLDDAKRLVRDGVDVLAHSVRDKPVDDELIQLMKQHGTYYIPTLQLEEAFFIYADKTPWMKTAFFQDALNPDLRAQFDSPEWVEKIERDKTTAIHRAALAQAKRNVKLLADAGLPIAFGTDSGAFPVRIQGFAEHRELYLMTSSGLSPLDVIHSATGVNARMLGISASTGTLEAGKNADLLILNGDPEKAIQNTTRLAAVWHRGVEVTLEKTSGVVW
ncbi:MAG: amidohydrolase family protein, partial [Bryobacteraceae bacterium]